MFISPCVCRYQGPSDHGENITFYPLLNYDDIDCWMQLCQAPPPAHLGAYPTRDGVSDSGGCDFMYWTLLKLDRISPPTGPLTGNTTLTVYGRKLNRVSSLYLYVDHIGIVQCDVLTSTKAVCITPPSNFKSDQYGGWKSTVYLKVGDADCKVGDNVTFYYHPDELSVKGPYPALVPLDHTLKHQYVLLDARPFTREGSLVAATDFPALSGMINVRSGIEMSQAVREDNIRVLFSRNHTETTYARVFLDTRSAISNGQMLSNCQDVNFWANDIHSSLYFWFDPFSCNQTDTEFIVYFSDRSLLDEISVSFGSAMPSTYLDGSIFALSDGFTTVKTGATPNIDAWVLPGSTSLYQQRDVERSRLYTTSDGYSVHQYRGNWSYLIMAETSIKYSAPMVLHAGWVHPKPATYVVYLSSAQHLPYIPFENDAASISSLFVTVQVSAGLVAPLIRVWGVDPVGRSFSNETFCWTDDIQYDWTDRVEYLRVTLSVGTNISNFNESYLSSDIYLVGGEKKVCELRGYGVRDWSEKKSADFWHFSKSASPFDDVATEDLERMTRGERWEYEPFPPMFVHSGVHQSLNGTSLVDDHDWVNTHAILNIIEETTSNIVIGEIVQESEVWRIGFNTTDRCESSQRCDISMCFNHQQHLDHQFTANLTATYGYVHPTQVIISPNVVDLTSYNQEQLLVLNITSPDITFAIESWMSTHNGSEVDWYDLPLNLNKFNDSWRSMSSIASSQVGIRLKLGDGEMRCHHAVDRYTMSCSTTGASKSALLSSFSQVQLSLDGGINYFLMETNLTFFSVINKFALYLVLFCEFFILFFRSMFDV
jgi:hypothetical protein